MAQTNLLYLGRLNTKDKYNSRIIKMANVVRLPPSKPFHLFCLVQLTNTNNINKDRLPDESAIIKLLE